MARPHAAVSTTGAFVYQPTDHRQYVRRESHPRDHFGRVACYCYTTDASPTSGSGGNRTHVNLLKRQAPSQRRTHFRFALAGSGPHGSRTRALPLDRRPLYRLSFWTVIPTSRWRRNRTPQDSAVGFGDRVRSQTQSPPIPSPTVPRAGVEPDLSGLKDHRPHRKSNGAYRRATHPEKANRPGVASYPRPARLPLLARQGLSARIQFRAFRIQTQTETLLQPARKVGGAIDRLRDNGGGRRVKFSARVPEGHGCIGCKLFTALGTALVPDEPLAAYV
jgi:hypothetical protein